MAGETTPQVTATAPVTTSTPPSAPPVASTGTPPTTSPPAAAPPTRQAKATKTSAAPAEPRRAASPGAEPTYHATEAELDRLLAEHDKAPTRQAPTDDTAPKAPTAPAASAAAPAQHQTQSLTTQEDPVLKQQREEAEAAATAAGLTLAEPPEPDPNADAPDDADKFNAWLETLPKGAKEKILRQQKKIGELKAQLPDLIQLQPTTTQPLAHVASEQQLEAERNHWQTVAHECRRLLREGTFDGAEITLANGTRFKLENQQQIEQNLAYAEQVLDAAPVWRQRLQERHKSAPWETAEKLAPGLFNKGSFANTKVLEVLTAAPQLKGAFPDWEVKLAHMARSMQMEEDSKATAEFPQGRRKWVALDLDAQGNVVLPTQQAKPVVNTKPVSDAAPLSTPSLVRPATSRPTEGDAKGHLDKSAAALASGNRLTAEEELDRGLRAWAAA